MALSLTRRNFVAGSAAAGLAAFAPLVASAEEIEWAGEADIIAVGAGAAGLTAAIEARDLDLSIIVFESLSYPGGSSRLCNGGIAMPGTPLQKAQGIDDSPELFAQDLITNTQSDNNPEWLTLHAKLAAGLWDWLTGLGLEFKQEGLLGTSGQSVPREHHITPTTVIDVLETKALEDGAEILYSTPVRRLIQDEDGRVIGVVAADSDGNEASYKANKAVILATDGFSRNPEMLNRYIFGDGADTMMIFSGEGDDGSGLNMAMAIGAQTRHLGRVWLLTGQNPDGMPGWACSLINMGAILVNQDGERFVDESLGYGNVWDKVLVQKDGWSWQIWDNDIAEDCADNESSLYSMAKLRGYDDLLIEADTIEELAGLIDVPAETLVATVNKYNNDLSETGVDTAFGRAHMIGEMGEAPLIDNGPFFAWKTGNGLYGTPGGLEVNLDQQVMHLFGYPIPGLYCAGTICTYAQQGVTPGTIKGIGASGTGFGGAIIWGRYAVQRIAELEA